MNLFIGINDRCWLMEYAPITYHPPFNFPPLKHFPLDIVSMPVSMDRQQHLEWIWIFTPLYKFLIIAVD